MSSHEDNIKKEFEAAENSTSPIAQEEQDQKAEEPPTPEIPKPPIIGPAGPKKTEYDDIMDISKF